MLILAGLALIVVLTAATGYFVAQEFAFVVVDRAKLADAAGRGDRAAGRALRVTGRLSFMLSGAQLGITVTALLVGFFAEPYLGRGLAQLFGAAGVPRAVSVSVAVVLAVGFATVVQMVLGELAPKNWAIARPEALARRLAGSTLLYLAVFGPVIRFFDAAANRLLRRVGVEPVEELTPGATADDLVGIVTESRAGGLLDADTSRLLHRGLEFSRRTAAEVMVPRVDVVTLRADEPAVRLVELLETGHSRFPVIGRGIDDVVGVAGMTDLLALPAEQRAGATAARIAAPPLVVPGSLPLPRLLDRLRGEHRQLAVVVDEYGGLAGVVTLEDVAEELVGAIRDEDDLPEPQAVGQPDGSWLVPGRWRIDEIRRATGIGLPASELYDTVSGLVLQRLGRIPRPGDRVRSETAGPEDGPAGSLLVEVVDVDRHVPATVRLTRSAQPAEHHDVPPKAQWTVSQP